MWVVFMISYFVHADTVFPTTSPSGVPTGKPSRSPTTGHPTFSPTSDPTISPTPEWGDWGDCISCDNVSSGPSLSHLAYNVCGCRESSRTCDMNIANYDCEETGIEIRVEGCDVDGLSFEISCSPTEKPTTYPSVYPTVRPTAVPTLSPTSLSPTLSPTANPTTMDPTAAPTLSPTVNTTGEALLSLSIIYQGWPPSRNVFESLYPLASLIEIVSLDQMDVKLWNYTNTEPYIMNVTYDFFLLSWSIEKEVVDLVDELMFADMLVTEILDYWNDDYVSLTVQDLVIRSSALISDTIMAPWTLGLITFGIFISCNAGIVILIALFREKKKKEFKLQQISLTGVRNRRSTIALLNSSPREEWDSGLISIERFGSVNNLPGFEFNGPEIPSTCEMGEKHEENFPIAVDIEEGDINYNDHRKSVKNFTTVSLKSPDRRSTYNTHDDCGSLGSLSPMVSFRGRPSSKSSLSGRTRKSTYIRDESRALRKSVFNLMKHQSSSSKVSLVVHSPRLDQDGDVNVNVTTRLSAYPSKSPRLTNLASSSMVASEPELGDVHHEVGN